MLTTSWRFLMVTISCLTINKRPIKEFEEWMEKMGLMEDGHLTEIGGDGSIFMRSN